MKNELTVPKGVDIVDFLSGVPSGTITDLFVFELPEDLISIQSILRAGTEDGLIHLIKDKER